MIGRVLILTAAVASFACATAAPAPTTTASADDGKEGTKRDPKMKRCPVTVEGATFEVQDAPNAVVVVVKTAGDANLADLRERASGMATRSKEAAAGSPTIPGGGGGFMRNCPIVSKDTLITASDVDGGSRIQIEPRNGLTLEDLKKETATRFEALKNGTITSGSPATG